MDTAKVKRAVCDVRVREKERKREGGRESVDDLKWNRAYSIQTHNHGSGNTQQHA